MVLQRNGLWIKGIDSLHAGVYLIGMTTHTDPLYCDFCGHGAIPAEVYIVRDDASKKGKRVQLCKEHADTFAAVPYLTVRKAAC